MGEGRLGVGIVGIGWVAHEHIRAWNANPQSHVVALASHSEGNAAAAARRHELSDATIYTDWNDLVHDPAVDVVDICSMNHLHVPQALSAAEAGKHLLIEKPASHSLDDLRRLQRAIREARVKSLVGFELHWSPYFKNVRSMIDNDFLGPVFYAECDYFSGNWESWYAGFDWVRTREKGGSALPAAGVHAVDAIRQFVASDAVEVFAYSGNFTGTMEWDASIVALIKFRSGAIGKVGCVLEGNMKYQFNVRLHGPRGAVVNDRFLTRLLPGQTDWAQCPTVLPDTPEVSHHPFQEEIDHLVDCIRDDTTPLVDIEDAARTHEIVLAAEQSAAEGRPVSLPLPG